MNGIWQNIEHKLSSAKNHTVHLVKKAPISGGCINQTWIITDNHGTKYFLKTNIPSLEAMFVAEANALIEIEQNNSIRTPHVLIHGVNIEFCYLILEYIDLKPLTNQQQFGIQLAKMHQRTKQLKDISKPFGWVRDNYIGSTSQSNKPHQNWDSFWKNERLLYQLDLAKTKGYSHKAYDKGLKLAESVKLFFTSYQPSSSLLHGDLWSGNCASDMNDKPVIYDPALYYGDREADIAMTELFGGFDQKFYYAYNDTYKLDSGYKTRKTLYNLYHILNHYVLFGGEYATQAENMTKQLLSEC